MELVVQKYGGTSVAGPERIRRVAERVVATAATGASVCVVVSAMGKTTDELIDLAQEVSSRPHPREMDMLLTAGERISMALLAMAIVDLGRDAVSFTGSQAGIVTDTRHGKAKIVELRADRVREALEAGRIAIVAGFQGVSRDRDVTTLGRGGSDTTAVALAAALGASVCEIYTDVDGVFTADPRLVPGARKLAAVSYEEMLELAGAGAGVLALRSVEYARNHGVRIHVRSSFAQAEGTWIVKEEDVLEQAIVSGIASDTGDAKVTMLGVPDRPGIAGRMFRPLADAGIHIDMIVQNVSSAGQTDISFTLPKADLANAEPVLDGLAREVEASGFAVDPDIGKVTVVGAGMRSHPGVAAAMFESLADAGINIEIISTSPIRISCVVRGGELERAVQVLHERFRLADDVVLQGDAAAGRGSRSGIIRRDPAGAGSAGASARGPIRPAAASRSGRLRAEQAVSVEHDDEVGVDVRDPGDGFAASPTAPGSRGRPRRTPPSRRRRPRARPCRRVRRRRRSGSAGRPRARAGARGRRPGGARRALRSGRAATAPGRRARAAASSRRPRARARPAARSACRRPKKTTSDWPRADNRRVAGSAVG